MPTHYVIMSRSEAGFWSNNIGWVFDIKDATVFSESELLKSRLPISKGNDATWIPVRFDE